MTTNRTFKILPVTVFLLGSLVVASQIYHQAHSHLTPWKVGGMGMFASLDSPAHREVSIEFKTIPRDNFAEQFCRDLLGRYINLSEIRYKQARLYNKPSQLERRSILNSMPFEHLTLRFYKTRVDTSTGRFAYQQASEYECKNESSRDT
jgi:hypothetical protein